MYNNQNVEVTRLQERLSMILSEFMRLQESYRELSASHERLQAASGQVCDTFTGRLLTQVADLYGRQNYSDVQAVLEDLSTMPLHKFVLRACGSVNSWGGLNLESANVELSLADFPIEVSRALLRWMYTNAIRFQDKDDSFLVGVLRAAHRFGLEELRDQCEQVIMPSISVKNCIKYYQLAEQLKAKKLRDHCGKVISAHWTDFTAADFADMPAGLLLDMFCKETKFPLHAAVRSCREDVVFLYLTKTQDLSSKINCEDERGALALDLALAARQEGMTSSLLERGADINVTGSDGKSLLHRAVDRADVDAATFLLERGCDVSLSIPDSRTMLLHMLASFESQNLQEAFARVAQLAIMRGAPVNAQDSTGATSLHYAVQAKNLPVLQVLLSHPNLDTSLRDRKHQSALWLALLQLSEGESSTAIAAYMLLERGASPDGLDSKGCSGQMFGDSLMQRAARETNEFAALFLAQRGANCNYVNIRGESALHTACHNKLYKLAQTLLQCGANPNIQMSHPLLLDGEDSTEVATPALSAHVVQDLEKKKKKIVRRRKQSKSKAPQTVVSSNALGFNNNFGNPFEEYEEFETVQVRVDESESEYTDVEVTDDEDNEVVTIIEQKLVPITSQTPLHVAVLQQDADLVNIFLDHKANKTSTPPLIQVDFSLRDSQGNTAFSLALWNGQLAVAELLLNATVPSSTILEDKNEAGLNLLHQAIIRNNVSAASFLMDHGSNINSLTSDNASPLQLAIRQNLGIIVEALCKRKADMNFMNHHGDSPLWLALQRHQGGEELASILVKYGCDVTGWGPAKGVDGAAYEHTLLFRAINNNQEDTAVFLVKHGADVNSPRRPVASSAAGSCAEEASDGQTPLHVAAAWGMERVVQALIENDADVNKQDSEGCAPIHIAIENGHSNVISLLLSHPSLKTRLKDRRGITPFAVAMNCRNQRAAQAILDRDAGAAEQADNAGRSFLHVAVSKADLESVLFLIGVATNVNSRVQDSQQLTALHLAVMSCIPQQPLGGQDTRSSASLPLPVSAEKIRNAELIIRHLLLAGALPSAIEPAQRKTPLHLAAEANRSELARVILEHADTDPNALTDWEDTALHLAIRGAHLATVTVLLGGASDRKVNLSGRNKNGRTPLLMLAYNAKENAVLIFDVLRSAQPGGLPLDEADPDGNTPLLIAYINGAAQLCAALVRAGAQIGIPNRQLDTIFSIETPTKQLIHKLLDIIEKEPSWVDGDFCLNCKTKFSVKLRKHHCRHCGRLVCAKCSPNSVPIVKFGMNRAERVCGICFDYLNYRN